MSDTTTSYRKMLAALQKRTEGDFTLLSQDEIASLSLARWREYSNWARYEPIIESAVLEIVYNVIRGDDTAASCSYEELRRAVLAYLRPWTYDDWDR